MPIRHPAVGKTGVHVMTMKTFFTVLAVLALIHGIGFVLAPEQVAASYGMTSSPSSILMDRLFGAALLGLGLIYWFARDNSAEAVRGLLIATAVGDGVGFIVVVLGTMAGTLNAMGWVATLIHLFGTAGSGYFLMWRSPQLSAR